MAGTPLAAVPNDIEGDPRNPNFPYKGCDEKILALRVLNMGGCLEDAVNNSQVKVILRTAGCANTDSCTADLLVSTNDAKLTFGDAVGPGPWFLDVISLNHLETYSAAPVPFAGPVVSYDFKSAQTQAFGSNLTAAGPPYCFFGGDRNQDGSVTLTDVIEVYNDAVAFLAGCRLKSDITNNGIVDLGDIIVTFNNSRAFVAVITPCPAPNSINGTIEELSARKKSDQSRIILKTNTANDF